MIVTYLTIGALLIVAYFLYVTKVVGARSGTDDYTYKTPGKFLENQVNYFPVEKKQLLWWNILGSATPAMVIGAIASSLWGPIVLLLIPVISLVFVGMTEYFLTIATMNNNGHRPEFVLRKIFGKYCGHVIHGLRIAMFIGTTAALMYIPTVMVGRALGFASGLEYISLIVTIPLGIWFTLMFSKKDEMAYSHFFSGILLIVTGIVFVLFVTNGDLLTSMANYEGVRVQNTIDGWASIFAFTGLALMSGRELFFTQTIVRHVSNKDEVPTILAWRRVTITIFLMVWALVGLGVNGASNINNELLSGNIFNILTETLSVVARSETLANLLLVLIGISVLFSINQEWLIIRRHIIRYNRGSSNDQSSIFKATLVQFGVLSLITIAIPTFGIELGLWKWLVVLSFIYATFATIVAFVYTGWRWGGIFALTTSLSMMVTAAAAAMVFTHLFGVFTGNIVSNETNRIIALIVASVVLFASWFRAIYIKKARLSTLNEEWHAIWGKQAIKSKL